MLALRATCCDTASRVIVVRKDRLQASLLVPVQAVCGNSSSKNVMLTFSTASPTFQLSASHRSVPSDWTSPGWGSRSGLPAWGFQQQGRQLRRLIWRSAICIHSIDRPPEGVPSSLFTFRPKCSDSHKTSDAREDGGDEAGNPRARTLEVGLVEDSDLDDVSGLLVEAFPADMILKDGEFSDLENVIIGAPLDMTNKYLRAVSYYEALYALKSRCGERLARGDFALTSEALVLAVKDPTASAKRGGTAGRIIAVVEMTLRQPNGSLPTNWPFPVPWRPANPAKGWEPYLCNLAVEKTYRGKGLGRQLVRLCEHVAKNHWGYKRLYLHVDLDDPAAMGLYSSMGYESMEQYDTPVWIRRLLGMPTIRYQVKQFERGEHTP